MADYVRAPNDISSTFLFFRKPGGYRKPTVEMEKRSFIPTGDFARWFAPVWTDVTGQLRRDHPAPFPLEIPRRLIRMFSFAGDVVVDPFAGTGTTAIAAVETGRNSVSVEIEPVYINQLEHRLGDLKNLAAQFNVHRSINGQRTAAGLRMAWVSRQARKRKRKILILQGLPRIASCDCVSGRGS